MVADLSILGWGGYMRLSDAISKAYAMSPRRGMTSQIGRLHALSHRLQSARGRRRAGRTPSSNRPGFP